MVSLSSRSTVRESPRVLLAGLVLAVCLVLIGLLIGMAGSGGRASASSGAGVSRLNRTVAAQAASLRTERARVSALQADLAATQRRAAHRAAALRRSRRATRCWRARALHPHTKKIPACQPSS